MSALPAAVARLLQRPAAERRLGPFLLVEPLGHGGFAPVWLAREVYGATVLRTAAVKLFSLEASLCAPSGGDARTAARDRIVAEACALCSVEHPNVVRFYALPMDEAEGVIGLAMEHVAGTPLDARIAAGNAGGAGAPARLSLAESLRVGIAIASALSAVHRAGLVHRDVKPSNIVHAAGVYKLIDFGIAAADALDGPPSGAGQEAWIAAADAAVSPFGATVSAAGIARAEPAPSGTSAPQDGAATVRLLGLQSGTVGYIDPVCFASGAPASPVSDLYALGATLFECLTGRVPAATGPTGWARVADSRPEAQLDARVLTGRAPPPALGDLVPDAPPALAALIAQMLSPDRAERPPSAEAVALRLEQIRREIAGLERALPPEDVGPFRGLGRFEERDRDVYFGRASEVAAALEVLRSRGLLALVGSSGSGKSSLARAGVLPALAEGALGGWPARWDTAVAEPGRDPRSAVAAALAPFVPDAAARSPEAVAAALAERAQSAGRGVVLLVDQLEELATIAGESRDWAAALLCRLGDQALPGVRAVAAARRDLLDPLLSVGQLGKALARGLVLIEPITELGWSEILDQALGAYGYELEDDALRIELLAELKGTAAAMPLVQFALTELWKKRDPERKEITRAGLREIGGIAGALERHAEATLSALERDRPGAAEAARAVLLALTTPDGTRATGTREELAATAGPAGEAALEALVEARLVVPCEGGITLAHEALLAQWGRLRAWVAEAREDRLLAGELERDAARWRADPHGVPLWQKRRLAYAKELHRQGTLRVSAGALAFLKASRRAARRVRLALAGAAAIAALSFLTAGVAYVRAVQAEEAETRRTLVKEQEDRRRAEEQRRELEEAQTAIAALTRELRDAKSKEEIRGRVDEILKVLGGPSPAPPPAGSVASRPPPPPPRPAQTAPSTAPSTATAIGGDAFNPVKQW
ncbi:MAG: protein kinase [Polyangiaceae bacterium]|nr:protein kinase [Polyangiaceae bacterium]